MTKVEIWLDARTLLPGLGFEQIFMAVSNSVLACVEGRAYNPRRSTTVNGYSANGYEAKK